MATDVSGNVRSPSTRSPADADCARCSSSQGEPLSCDVPIRSLDHSAPSETVLEEPPRFALERGGGGANSRFAPRASASLDLSIYGPTLPDVSHP